MNPIQQSSYTHKGEPRYTRSGELKTGVRYIHGYRIVRGNRQFPNLDIRKLWPWMKATKRYATRLLMQGDYSTALFAIEAGRTMSSFQARPQSAARNRSTALSPRHRAEAIVWNILDQKRVGAFELVLRAMAVTLAMQHAGLKPQGVQGPWEQIQIARAVSSCLKSTVKVYEREDMQTGEIVEVRHSYRMGRLSSYHVALRVCEMVEPLYREWAREHGGKIASMVFRKQAVGLRKYSHALL